MKYPLIIHWLTRPRNHWWFQNHHGKDPHQAHNRSVPEFQASPLGTKSLLFCGPKSKPWSKIDKHSGSSWFNQIFQCRFRRFWSSIKPGLFICWSLVESAPRRRWSHRTSCSFLQPFRCQQDIRMPGMVGVVAQTITGGWRFPLEKRVT